MKSVLFRSIVLSGTLMLLVAPVAQATTAANQSTVDKAVAYLKTQQSADGHIGNPGSDTGWAAVALASSGLDLSTVKTAGGSSLRAYLAANPPASTDKATDWERSIIAVTADGQNPYNFSGTDYVAKLKSFAVNHQIGLETTSNDDFFGLIALLSAKVMPTDTLVTDELSFILTHQHSDGGFSYSADASVASDTNDTAAAMMALTAAQNAGLGSAAVTQAIAAAKAYEYKSQNTDGGFPYDPLTPATWGGPVSDGSSTSWVLMALNALGLQNDTPGLKAQAYLRTLPLADGSFPSYVPTTGDVFDTAPAVTALNGGTYPLKVYAGIVPEVAQVPVVTSPTPTPSPTPSPAPIIKPAVTTPATPTGSVLGASTTNPPIGGSGVGSVLGSSTLPAVGTVSNLLLLTLALVVSVIAGLAIRLRQIRVRARR